MRTRSRWRLGWSAAGALAVVAVAPGLAQAQQNGLFPLAPIRRERVPCALEDPVYRLYRDEYFGYHPTCWRRFPAGWGCPSPEAPDPVKSFTDQPRDEPPPLENIPEALPGPGEDMPPAASPFERPAPGPNGAAPGDLPPLPRGGRSPFDLETPPPPGGVTPPGDRAQPPGGAAPELPPVEPPGLEPPRGSAGSAAPASASARGPIARTSHTSAVFGVTPPPAVAGDGAGRELQPLPDAAPAPGVNAVPPPPPGAAVAPNVPIPAGRVLAPQRTTLLGNFFSGRLFRR